MTKKPKKKSPSEYPLFAIRLESDKKDQLNDMVESVRESLNSKLDPTQKLWMKNDVIYEALLIGLPLLKSRTTKKKSGKK